MLRRLHVTFGISGVALKWFESYLIGRTQFVDIGGVTSDSSVLKFGVPQGSVLGPVLFTMYMKPLSSVINHHGLLYHMFADDTQLQKSAPPSHFLDATAATEACISSVNAWMRTNKLKMNNDKTELLPVATVHKLNQVSSSSSLEISDVVVPFSSKVKNLGVVLDSTLSMEYQINSLCSASSFQLRRLSQIRSFLTVEAATKLACSSILSRLDYCNSLLVHVDEGQLDRLQRIQNHAARIILRKRKRDHATPLLCKLHWLPIRARISYKLSTLCYRCREGTAPSYLSSLLEDYSPERELRSSQADLFTEPRYKLEKHGRRAFSIAAPRVWNSLPKNLRNSATLPIFKSGLKTYLFKS
jgi:hypothetical protein